MDGLGGLFNSSSGPTLPCVLICFSSRDIDEAKDVSNGCGPVVAGIADAHSLYEDPPVDVLQ